MRGVGGKVAIWSSARVSCVTASTRAERANDRCPALPHRPCGFFDQSGFAAVSCKKFGLAFSNLGELAFESFGDARMQCASRIAKQRAIGSVLHQCVLEQISRVRRHSLPEQQARL